MRAFVLVSVAVLAFAGCVSQNAAVSPQSTAAATALPANWFEKALEHGQGHDHKDILQHQNASTPNFELLGHDPLLTQHYNGAPAFGYGCGGAATSAQGRKLVVVSAFENDLAFVLVDVTDPAHPQKVGEFYSKGMASYDADITPDGKYVSIAMNALLRQPGADQPAVEVPRLEFRSACATQELAMPDLAFHEGIVLIDISNPMKPTYADWDFTPGLNLHSVSSARIDNVTWVMGSELGLSHQSSYFVFDQIMDTPLGAKLVRMSTFDSPPVAIGDSPTVPIFNGHTDVVMQKHPLDHKTYAYIADWEGGVLTLDMSVPQVPVLVSSWTPPGGSPTSDLQVQGSFLDAGPCYHNAIHEVLPAPTAWDGKFYLFAGQECPMKVDSKAPGGQVFVLDATDPKNVHMVGEWHLPEDTGKWTVEYQASPHYLSLVNRTLFVSDYHAGLWAADVSTPEALKSPPSIGVYLPSIPPPVAPKKNDTIPFDEQVDVFPDGTIVLNEDTTGLYVLRFDATHPAPPAAPFDYKKSG
jgi:hypothetical protein